MEHSTVHRGGLGSRGTADNNYNDEDVDEDGDNGHDGDDMKNIAMRMMGWPTSACCRWQNSESDDDVDEVDDDDEVFGF